MGPFLAIVYFLWPILADTCIQVCPPCPATASRQRRRKLACYAVAVPRLSAGEQRAILELRQRHNAESLGCNVY